VTDPLTIINLDDAPNLAVDVLPTVVEGTFILDDSELGGVDLLGWGDEGWVNIVCDVTRLACQRGATRMQGVLTRSEAADVVVELLDYDRRFDPLVNADAIHAGTPVRVRAWQGPDPEAPDWSAVLVTGELDDVPVVYDRTGPPRVTLTASDVIATFARWTSAGRAEPGIGSGDTLLERVDRMATEMSLVPEDVIAEDVDPSYATVLAPSTLANGWDVITRAADAELGRVWADSGNRLVVRARDSLLSGPVRGTLSDWHDETVDYGEPVHCCYAELAAALGTEQMINRTIGQRRALDSEDEPEVVQLDDTVSQALHRVRVGEGDQRDLELLTDEAVQTWCESVLLASSRPELRVDSVTPAPWSAGDEAWQAVLETDLGDRWALRYHPETGPTVMRTVGVLGIRHEVTPDGWSIAWTTAPAPTPGVNPSGWFALDISELGTGDLLAPYGGAVGALPD
jgi:hypothetical protein